MKIEAMVNFCGAITMSKGEIRDCGDETVVSDLLRAGYVKEVSEKRPDETEVSEKRPDETEVKTQKPKTTTRKIVKK